MAPFNMLRLLFLSIKAASLASFTSMKESLFWTRWISTTPWISSPTHRSVSDSSRVSRSTSMTQASLGPCALEHILEETSATLDEEGFIADFPDCPDQIVLQSHPYNTVIGISSTSRQKIKEKMSGWAFWKQFQKDCPTKTTWKSLSEHFMEDLRGTIMDLHYDLKTKIELYFAFSVPVEEETLREFKTIAMVVLAKGYIIKYAAGHKFSIGRKDNVVSDEKELEDHNEREKCKLSFLAMMECERKREEEEEMKALEHLPNLHKMPFDLTTKAVLYYKSVFIVLFWNVFSFKFI
ncbi:hypothetical protein CAEBREN_11566 [Caenorhabditis brenneri]|uniref:SPK domain-containing protein n=1 Tax=Caenorhabditis brenneri TaxID=135651 RepID=G0P2G9_CAEBE|nr:hypothetical protein CAEBREN_11566 [Caenorhabditis brenneri]